MLLLNPPANSSLPPFLYSSSLELSFLYQPSGPRRHSSMASLSFYPPPTLSSSSSHLLFTAMVFLISLLFFVLTRRNKSKTTNLPPGPPGWPIVGNLFQVSRSGKPFFVYIDELRRRYGPICTLKMGTRTMIILSDANLAHEALIKKGAVFANRPSENPTRNIFSSNKFSVNAAVYGSVWRSLRRNMVENMLSSSRIKEFREVRENAMDKLISRTRAESEANNGLVSVRTTSRFAVFCILLAMCFGLEMDEETVEKMDQTLKSVLITLEPRIDDFLPMLRFFFTEERKRVQKVRKDQVDFIVKFINRRRRALEVPGSDSSATSFSYLDTLFNLKVDGRKSPPNDSELVTLCSEFLNGGTDTTATAIEWGIAQLIANPQVQEELYDEIKSKVGDKRVDEKDVETMPYLHGVVKEVLRKHPPTYFTLTHAVTEPTKLGGYDIPADANIEIFLPAIGEDPKLWKNPEKFDPRRFVSGEEDADITGVTGVKMMPFGVGRRICPGLGMATVHVHLMMARMVQEFEWSAWPKDSALDFTGKLEFTIVMESPLKAMVKPRV